GPARCPQPVRSSRGSGTDGVVPRSVERHRGTVAGWAHRAQDRPQWSASAPPVTVVVRLGHAGPGAGWVPRRAAGRTVTGPTGAGPIAPAGHDRRPRWATLDRGGTAGRGAGRGPARDRLLALADRV